MKEPQADAVTTRTVHVLAEHLIRLNEVQDQPPVYPSYELARHFEELAREMALPLLEDDEMALGFEIALQHVNTALEGSTLSYKAEFAALEGDRFTVNCYANSELGDLIGRGHATLRLFSASRYAAGLEKLEERMDAPMNSGA